ncbi:ParB N-terminal domain-containing protein [Cupriavidus sp. KK10]|jgi:ParB-like chromosome segregation protein Spo0J|uniref:ParB N-terminal domain-containing protein n=1 Tax=Cupriavidus sp. KK10 TaxID=1478019 RepID=UPI001BAB4B7B|nr:ParB N-terminal domain-containing protein [Cupriavidus sp. KK10]
MSKRDALTVEYRPIEALIPYARNARTHSEAQIAQIAGSLREFGWTNPVLVDGDGTIIAGHGRVLAARQLGEARIPVISLAHLSEAQRRAYVLADNKLAEQAGWDKDLLSLELADLSTQGFDLTVIGFKPEEIEEALVGRDFGPGSEDEQGKLDAKKQCTCPNCGHEFTP